MLHLLVSALIIFPLYSNTMHHMQDNTTYNLTQIPFIAPEDIWLHIIAHSETKGTMREICSYFRDLASTKNEKLFLEKLLRLTSDALDIFTLYYADFENNEILNNLLSCGANPNTVDDNNMSVMHYLAKNGNLAMIETLFKHPQFVHPNLNADTVSSGDWSPFILAARGGHESITDYMLAHCTMNYDNMLYLAIQYDLPKLIEKLLPHASQGSFDRCTPMSPCECQQNYISGDIHNAAIKGYINVVKAFLDKGTSVNLQNKRHSTPLHYVITGHSTDMIKFLVNNKADVNIADQNGYTPLYRAVGEGSITRVLFLLHHGADVNAKDVRNKTILGNAIQSSTGSQRIIRLLLAYNATIDGDTLYDYRWQPDVKILTLLIKKSGDKLEKETRKNVQFLSCLIQNQGSVSVYLENPDLFDLIIQKSCITEEDGYGHSPLTYALKKKKNIAIIKKLLEQPNIDINILYNQMEKKVTALDIALHYAQKKPALQEIVDLLKKRGAKTKAELEQEGSLEIL
jgi:ankyrin repeat protein